MGNKHKVFEIRKIVLCASPIVQPYSLTKGATMTADASEKAIDRVLSQEGLPVIYVSKHLSQVEQNYFNNEREALAIVFEVTRQKQVLLGMWFTRQTDHHPPKYLFEPDEGIPNTAPARFTI